MALTFSVNVPVATAGGVLFALKAALKAGGWIVVRSGDGSTYYPDSDGITHENAGAGGMGNARAWYQVRQADSDRGFVFSMGTNTTSIRIKYSVVGFPAGAPSATVAPASVEEQLILGAGTDANPTGAGLGAITAGQRIHCAADGRKFWAVSTYLNAGVPSTIFGVLCDELTGTHPLDDDPFVVYAVASAAFGNTFYSSGTAKAKAWIRRGMSGAAFAGATPLAIFGYSTGNVVPRSYYVNPFDGTDQLFPCVWAKNDASDSGGYKGVSSLFKLPPITRAIGDLFTVNTPGDLVFLGAVVVDWNGSVMEISG